MHRVTPEPRQAISEPDKKAPADPSVPWQALLDLLVHMTEWDMLDFSGEIGRRKFDIGGVSFMGLSAVLRMVTPAVLEVPELSQKLFSLLLHLVQAYPDHLSRLDPQLFGMILQV